MSISEMLEVAGGEMAAKLDDEISFALNQHWGNWTMDDVKRRCKIIRQAGSQVETLYADEVPLIEIHPIHSNIERTPDSMIIRYTRNVRRLVPVKTQESP